MYVEFSWALLILIIPLYGFRPNDLEKTEAIDYIPEDNKENFEVGPLSCDLTKNVCDINCCSDKDCSDVDRASFDCNQNPYFEEALLFDRHLCDRVSSQDLEARPMLCLQHANSPYLGEVFIEDEPFFQKLISKIIQSRKKQIRGFINQLPNTVNYTHSYDYYYGSYILKSDDKGKKSNIYLPSNIITESGFCIERPLRFLVNTKSNCLYSLSKSACLTKTVFQLNNFITAKFKVDGGEDKRITIYPEVVCLTNGTKYVTFSKNIFNSINSEENMNSETRNCNGDFLTRLSYKTDVCKNVVVSLSYFFYINMTSITSIRAKVLLADIPISVNAFLNRGSKTLLKPIDKVKEPNIYLSQSFSTVFINNNQKAFKTQGYKFRDALGTNSNHSSLT